MLFMSAALFLTLLGFELSRHDISAVPSEEATTAKMRISDSSEAYSTEILDRKLNQPGISTVYFSFAAPQELFKPMPDQKGKKQSAINYYLGRAENTLWEGIFPWNMRFVAVELASRAGNLEITSPQRTQTYKIRWTFQFKGALLA